MEILESLEKSKIVIGFQVHEYKEFEKGFYLKIIANLTNETTLHIREYSDEFERNYSYHWQTPKGQMIVRWDNAPHHKDISSFPNHKHIKNKIIESTEISIPDILKYIEKEI